MTLWRRLLGSRGERIAARHLRRAGCRILARNVTTPFGEIDLIAQERRSGRIIFAEVKTRSRESIARGEHAVGPRKQRHIVRSAQAWLKRRRVPTDTPLRFDVLAVTFDAAGRPEVRHHEAAFGA